MDIMIFENGDGGEIEIINDDIVTVPELANQTYISHFGGNIEANTTGNEFAGQERFDWWGNSFIQDPNSQFNSNLERTLNNTEVSSSGRVTIENAAKSDIEHLSDIAEVDSEVSIIGDNKISISDKLREPNLNINSVFRLVWDQLRQLVITDQTI